MTLEVELNLNRPGFELDVRCDIPASGVSVVFGPSGCGKSTLLRCIAGLEHGQGRIQFNDQIWQESSSSRFTPPHRRSVGMVFQNPSLFEHLDVEGNLHYPVRRKHTARETVDRVIETLDLQSLLGRRVGTLSGGENQRVALARALLSEPQLLLLDEPLAALDEVRKREIMPYLERVSRQARIPVVYVTHNIDELFTLADYLLVMDNGGVFAQGRLSEVLSRLDLPLSQRDDAGAILSATVVDRDERNHLTVLEWASQRLWIPALDRTESGDEIRLRVQARDVSLCLDKPAGSSILNILPGRVLEIGEAQGKGQRLIRLGIGSEWLFARISELSCRRLGLGIGMPVFVQIKSVALVSG